MPTAELLADRERIIQLINRGYASAVFRSQSGFQEIFEAAIRDGNSIDDLLNRIKVEYLEPGGPRYLGAEGRTKPLQQGVDLT